WTLVIYFSTRQKKENFMRNKKPSLLVSDSKCRIFDHPGLEATGMKAGIAFVLNSDELMKMPAGSQLFKLPSRLAVGYDPIAKSFVTKEDLFAVAAFPQPGHTLTYSTSYLETGKVIPLPLFAYGACALYNNEIYIAAVKVDKDRRHDSTLIDLRQVKKNVLIFRKYFPKNRLIMHLADCAVIHGCPNAQNFFLSRYEAPLPTSPSCNANCRGCISYQTGKTRCSQPRIKFVPRAEEVSQIALFHISRVKDSIVSFGQGCEGEPLLQGRLIEESIRLIRGKTSKGTININTNGSLPDTLNRLFKAGLDSARISLNSARENYYAGYYQPRGYSFGDVLKSMKIVKLNGGVLSINYLTMPGFTDSRDEINALERLIAKYKIDMIQWRNLNYDPILYFKTMKTGRLDSKDFIGIDNEIKYLKKLFPAIRMGYFNPRVTASQHR
ncbi:MAG: radical SAM protein, partial [Candidatus Omnitrophica bacterium]|nr:radical SAM protein [Candidatus Omnitrophota bacterium]